MTTVLVANRGEIAVRVFRTAKRMGMRAVAVYSDADALAPHVRAADTAIRLGPAPAADSYLRRDRIIEAARQAGAELIHPGYGFLAEDARFARACEEAGLVFVGPPSKVLAEVGDKVAVRRIAADAGVPMLPAYDGEDQSDEALVGAARTIGYPLLIKPAGGGGGKGMTVVEREGDLVAALSSSRRVARAAFDDDRLLLEHYLASPRHIEVQVMADAQGHVIHLGERDCSLQRRHQKLMEETPAPNLDRRVRESLWDAAVSLAAHADYVGAGTCEFLVAGDTTGFIEMNARLQVEHPVTELVTGLDLVELQLRVALGEALPITQGQVRSDGHAIEVRVYAEDPAEQFLPQTGRVLHVRWPDGARVDTGIEVGTDVTADYDPLLAKIVVHGEDRPAAVHGLQRALRDTEILGPRTNVGFLQTIAREDAVVTGTVTTDWLDAYGPWTHAELDPDAAAAAAAAEVERLTDTRSPDPWSRLARDATTIVLRPDGVERAFVVRRGESPGRYPMVRTDDAWLVWSHGAQHEIPVGPAPRRLAEAGPAHLDSPLPGQVIAVRVAGGDHVHEGAELVVVEAMKMEHAIRAPADGTVTAVKCAPGDKVDRGQSLVDFEPA